jgi:predicted nucleic acid-binding protein
MLSGAHILLDTNILSNLLSKQIGLAEQTNKLLNDLILNENELYISDFTKYEFLRTIPKNKEKECNDLLNQLIHIKHTNTRFERSVHLYNLYKNHLEVSMSLNSISDIDVFIASLIFTTENTYLLSSDYCDFPRPFFLEKDIWRIEYIRKRGNKASLYYYLFEANLSEF